MFQYLGMFEKDPMNDQATIPTETSTAVTPVFLVLEKDMLIAEDIIATLKAMGPCRTIHVSSPDEIGAHLSVEARLTAALLEMQYAHVLEAGLDTHLAERGARIILTIGEDDMLHATERGWGMLVRPFTDQTIRDVLAQWPSEPV